MTAKEFSTEEFETEYTYPGDDLGAVWSREKTVFRVWAPTAGSVKLRLYTGGDHKARDCIGQLDMQPDVKGTWVAEAEGDLNGLYYTFLAEVDGVTKEACDPYARATGANGRRAMVLDLSSTDPEGWEADRNPNAGRKPTDAVIYELHIRDFSCDSGSGIRNRGKFLGLTESGTVNAFASPTGLDHILCLGVTHLQLLPVFDFGSVDETGEETQYNWGYDPVNYNVPEGSYSTDPRNGAVRVRELKQMIKCLHDRGLSVVMDVVYNHVYQADRFCFNRIVPGYFSRMDDRGRPTDCSGCGNDTASERSMVRKYIVDSVTYWAKEYHIDGFRFDLAGLLDTRTVNEAMASVRSFRPDALFYGEGWQMGVQPTKPGLAMTDQEHAALVPGFAFFNDSFRDMLRGSVFDNEAPGYISGAQCPGELVKDCFRGLVHWCPDPERSVNYTGCHDNMTLYDRITLSTPGIRTADRIRMNKLAAAFCLCAQGIPLLHAGEEMLRSKPLPDGGFDANSYRSPDCVNSLKWNDLNRREVRNLCAYYRGLIALRKTYGNLRLSKGEEVRKNVLPLKGLPSGVAAFLIRGSRPLVAVFNPGRKEAAVSLPEGKWGVVVNDRSAGTAVLAEAAGTVTVPPICPMILVKISHHPQTERK